MAARTNVPTAVKSPTGETVAGDQLRTHSAIPLSELPPMTRPRSTSSRRSPASSGASAGFGPLRRDIGETIQAALLFADLRGFTALSESNPPRGGDRGAR